MARTVLNFRCESHLTVAPGMIILCGHSSLYATNIRSAPPPRCALPPPPPLLIPLSLAQVMSLTASPYRHTRTVDALVGKLRSYNSLSSGGSLDRADGE